MRILATIYNLFYWHYYNYKYHTRIYNRRISHKVKVGKYVMIRKNTEVYSTVEIGDYSYISGPGSYVEAARIGKFCSIARNVVIGVGEHNYNWVTTHPIITSKEYNIIDEDNFSEQKSATIIGNDVWVGINAIVLRGVTIGDGAVIAAGSVVTRDVEPYSIVGGIPAKHIKYRFDELTRNKLLALRWWDWPEEKLRKNSKLFYKVDNIANTAL